MAFQHHLSMAMMLLIACSLVISYKSLMVEGARSLLETPLPEVPELPKAELPPLPTFPTLPKPELPPLPQIPTLPKPELPHIPNLPELPKPSLPTIPAFTTPPHH